ncbi:NAD-P-binding protein [Mycena albidolilacea]|uniref:NAD-P-binding protein n=1 Tax=Mycena albidolilacea TaxID=1033008 RepID=A0AAD6ZM19_9AGAR|nr:NAD-P-binding protein [Mycena albidolilacea]
MPSLASAKASNSTFRLTYLPVAVFIGGTSGIGRAMVEAFAQYTKGNAHIVIVGRNKAAAESILASLPKPSLPQDGWQHEFVPCDASLMKNIGAFTDELLKHIPKINFLVISSGYCRFSGRKDTEEGIDEQLALRYYGRWKFISDLLPALREANSAGEASHVMSVLDPVNGILVPDLNDFGLKRKYSGVTAVRVTLTYTDMALEEFALRDPGITFTHITPGFVNTPMLDSKDWATYLFKPLVWLAAISPAVCAEHMLFALFDIEKRGFIRRGSKGDDIGMKNYCGTKEGRKKLWEHTVQEVDVERRAGKE